MSEAVCVCERIEKLCLWKIGRMCAYVKVCEWLGKGNRMCTKHLNNPHEQRFLVYYLRYFLRADVWKQATIPGYGE